MGKTEVSSASGAGSFCEQSAHKEDETPHNTSGGEQVNLVWKDTELVKTGETVDIVLDPSNVGTWMAHCHIAEHLEAGMMFNFKVEEYN